MYKQICSIYHILTGKFLLLCLAAAIPVGFDLQPTHSLKNEREFLSATAGIGLLLLSSFQYYLCGLPFCHASVTQGHIFSCPGATDHVPSLWRNNLSPPLRKAHPITGYLRTSCPEHVLQSVYIWV